MRRYVALMQRQVPGYGDGYTLGFTNFNYPHEVNWLDGFWPKKDTEWCRINDGSSRVHGSSVEFFMDTTPLVAAEHPVLLQPSCWFFKEVNKAEYKNGVHLLKLPELVMLSGG